MSRILPSIHYVLWLIWQVLVSSWAVAVDALTPGSRLDPRIVKLPLRCRTDLEIAMMASSITITPGTLVVGQAPALDQHPPALFVHAMYGASPEDVIADLEDMESRLLRATRGRAA